MKLLTDTEARKSDATILISCARLAATLKRAGEVRPSDTILGFCTMNEGDGGLYIYINTNPEDPLENDPGRGCPLGARL